MHPTFQSFLKGDFGLAKTFWGGILLGMLLSALLSSILGAKLTYLLMIPFSIAFYMATWRAAERYTGERLWKTLAQVIVVFSAFFLAVSILQNF